MLAIRTMWKSDLINIIRDRLGESYFIEEILKLENNVGLPDEAIAMACELAGVVWVR